MVGAKALPEKWEVTLYWKEELNAYHVDVYDIGDGSGGYFKFLVSFSPDIPRQLKPTINLLLDRDGDLWYTEIDCPNWLVGQITYQLNKQD